MPPGHSKSALSISATFRPFSLKVAIRLFSLPSIVLVVRSAASCMTSPKIFLSSSERLAHSVFEITVELRPGKSPDEALRLVDEELARLRSLPPSVEELERARTRLLANLVTRSEPLAQRADMLNRDNQLTGDPSFLEKNAARYRALSAASLQQAVVSHLPDDRRVVAIVTPTPGAPRAGRLAGAP